MIQQCDRLQIYLILDSWVRGQVTCSGLGCFFFFWSYCSFSVYCAVLFELTPLFLG